MRLSSSTWALFCISVSCVFISHLIVLLPSPCNALNRKIALLEHDGERYRMCWDPQGSFAGLLQGKRKTFSAIPALKLSSGIKKSHLSKLSRKFKLPIYPSLVLKPFILVEELQWAIAQYQAKKIKTPVDRDFQLKDDSSAKLKTFQKASARTTRKKPFLFSPYYRRLYGLHVEFQW